MCKEKKFKRVILLVIDGLGIGEMEDTKNVRPLDVDSNTAFSVITSNYDIEYKNLRRLGLHYLAGIDTNLPQNAIVSKSNLKHFGADSFFGHQEIMGTNPIKPEFLDFNYYISDIKKLLDKEKIKYEIVNKNPDLLLIEDCFTIGDNIETDLGQAFNVTADLNILDFEKVVEIAMLIRKIIKVPRLIVFGSKDTSVSRILDCIEIKENKFIGVNAPKSGVYTDTYQCVHLGYGIDYNKQASYNLTKNGYCVSLIGKTADVITATNAKYFPCVDTTEVMKMVIKQLSIQKSGLIFINVQETDLSGHEQNVYKFGEKLKIVDQNLGVIMNLMNNDDLLIVMADHGNDPLIKHSQHTREKVPIMIFNNQIINSKILRERETMADIGQTIYDILANEKLEFGTSFKDKL